MREEGKNKSRMLKIIGCLAFLAFILTKDTGMLPDFFAGMLRGIALMGLFLGLCWDCGGAAWEARICTAKRKFFRRWKKDDRE